MATKPKGKPSKSPFGDDSVLDSLFDDKKHSARGRASRGGPLNRSFATDNIFSMLAEEVKKDGGDSEDSDVSAADPNDILKNMKDMDDMDADLFASKKKPSSAPAQTKPFGNEGPKKDSTVLENNGKPEGADEPSTGGRKPNSAPSMSTARNYKKFTFSDLDDPLDDLLGDLLPDETKPESKTSVHQTKPEQAVQSPSASPVLKSKTYKAAKTPADLTFDDGKDDLMDALGFDSDKNNPKKKESPLWSNKERGETPQRARTRLDEILESLTSPRLLERPATGEMKDQPLPQEKQQQQEKNTSLKEPLLEDDLTFGSYQPTLGSTPEGRHSRRQSVRFSTEDVSASTPEKKPKPTTPISTRHRNSADWLGLKTNDDNAFLEDETKETKISLESPKALSSPLLERKPSLTGSHATSAAKATAETPAPIVNIAKQTKAEVSTIQKKEEEEEEEEEDDWLAGALSRKKAQSASNSEAKKSKQEDSFGLGEEVHLESFVSKQTTSQATRGREGSLTSVKASSNTFLGQPSPAAHSTPVREERTERDTIPTYPSTPPLSPSIYTECTPTAQPCLPSTLPSSSLTAEVDLGQTLSLSHPSDYPSQLTGPLPVSAPNISQPQPQPQSSKGSRVLRGPNKPSDETLQQLLLPNLMSTTLPGTMGSVPQQSNMQNTSTSVQQQVTFSADSLQQLLLQQQMQSQLLGLGGVGEAAVLQRFKDQPGDYQVLQARIVQLEGLVKTLQLERDQSQMLLESVQQQHKQDMELMENTHKARVKLLEESASQRETRARQEYEDLMERLATVTRSAEQERSELQAQYQRKLAQAQQDRDREVERLRDLQRKSILEMKKDHEDQVHRLKRLKDEEIDAVTSATSQTRSLTVVIEQMEQFSSRLGELSSRVESTHEHTAHGLEQGARHRDEQLRIMQDRLAQQQKAMVEERAYLKEIISRMDTQLNEQQRQLEKERWKMTAEQAKAESTQRGLEEERRSLSMQINMEREELERAKSALLDEQKSVMQHCAEERRKLAAEWTHFHAQEKQRHERAEREVSSLLEKREGSIISLAQEQADLKLRTGEVKQKEIAVAQEREALEKLREELDREKERISSTALRLKTRAQEVEAFSKLAAEKYEEGERTSQEAKRVEAEHEARLRNIHIQTERLRQQEQRILQERMQLSHLQTETERLRQDHHITSLPQMIPSVLPDSVAVLPNPELASTLNIPPPTSFANTQSMALQASLALWKYTAEKDHEYLQEEQIFLENLKKKSYRSSFNTD
uniref:Fas binding factor 1 n=1 Tax=Seriola dumerili TaxID=41447 RepID=A0A3B4UTJ8_SERDU